MMDGKWWEGFLLFLLVVVPTQASELNTAVDRPVPILQREVLAQVTSARRQTLQLEVAGRVVSERLAMGQQLRKGDIIIQLDDSEARAKTRQLRAELDNIEGQLAFERRQLVRSQKNYERGILSVLASEKAQLQVARLETELARAQALLEIAALQVAKHRLAAPFGGTPHPGELVDPAASAIYLLDAGQLLAATSLSPAEVTSLKSGELWVALRSDPDQLLTLRELAPAADSNSGLVAIDLRLPTSLRMIPGQSLYLGLYRRHTDHRAAGEQWAGAAQ